MFAKNKKTLTLVMLAAGLGLIGVLLSVLYLKGREAELRSLLKPKSQPIAVVVSRKDLLKGDVLDTSTLSVRKIPRDYVSHQAILPGQFEEIEGKILQQNLAAGRPLLRSFIGDEFPLDFSDTIVEKRRAMTIQVDEINSIAGLLRPGNRVDLMVNMAGSSLIGKQVMPVLDNVEVLSTGRETARDYEEKVRILRGGTGVQPKQSYTTLTLNVTSREAALLTIAQDEGDIIALLRNREDTSGSTFAQISASSLQTNAEILAQQARLRDSTNTLTNKNITKGEDGLWRTKDGTVLANQDLIVGEDGSIRTKDGIDLASRGLSINEHGQIITKDGKVIDPNDLTITADGTLLAADGTVLGGKSATGLALKGATINADGKLVLADGQVIDPADVEILADGTVVTKDGQILAGVTAGEGGFRFVDYIVGGVSKDGVAEVNKLPVTN